MGADSARDNTVGVGYASFFLKDGDIFRISVRPNRKGCVKLKQVK